MSTAGGRVMAPALLAPGSSPDSFPPPAAALREPNGLLAIGGDLGPERLLFAYRHAIFPWYSDDQPILWWSPQPRYVIYPDRLRVSRSLAKTVRQRRFRTTVNDDFEGVIKGCAQPRAEQDGTWITDDMRAAYLELHARGLAMSIECWDEGRLAGGLYGVPVGRVFFGESMFTRVRDASKVALVHLCRLGFSLIDCQLPNPHLSRMGAVALERSAFIHLVERLCEEPRVNTPGAQPESTR